jgi:hypothetical protein
MNKKLFALASVSALAGLVATAGGVGCTVTGPATPPGTDASVDSGPSKLPKSDAGTKKDGGAKDDEEEGDDEEPETPQTPTCASKTAIDLSKIPYEDPLVLPGSCSEKDLTAISDYVANLKQTDELDLKAWKDTVSEKCASCVFTSDTSTDGGSALWGPILVDGNESLSFNRGSCVGIKSAKASCGEAYHKVFECQLVACLPESQGGFGSCTTQKEFDDCRKTMYASPGGPCQAAAEALIKECGANYSKFEDECPVKDYVFESTIRAQCIGDGTDSDAGGP